MSNLRTKSQSPFPRLFMAVTLLLVACVTYAALNAVPAQGAGDDRPTIGLVNDDLAAQFNGDEYAFGASFVDRISKDSEYNWVVLSRSVAEKAYNDGSVDAVLYIPQSFTGDLLTLQELSPTKATVEYRLQHQADQQADQLLESKIIDIVHGLNQSVLRMYFASLADNFAEADGYAYATLSNQEALIAALAADVQEPFSGTLPNIEALLSSASNLKGVNASTVEAQNAFTESVTTALTASSEALSGQLPAIDEYMDRQQEIARINTSNSNKGITDQAASDLGFYGSQYTAFKTRTLCMLSGLDAADSSEPCIRPDGTAAPHLNGLVTELNELIAQHTTGHGQAVADLYDDLDERIRNLQAVADLLQVPPEPIEPICPGDPDDTIGPVCPSDPDDPIGPVCPSDPDDPNGAVCPTCPSDSSDPADPIGPACPVKPVDPQIIAALEAEVIELTSVRDSLGDALPAPKLDSVLADLGTWYDNALAVTKDTSLAAGNVTTLEASDWSSYTPDSTGLYVDSSNDLYTNVTELVSQTAQTSSQIASSAATVPDNTSQFDALLGNATTTLHDAEGLFAALNDLVDAGNTGLTENQGHYANFSTILANTRAQGVDTTAIYDFFAAPIEAKNITPKRAAVTSTVNPARGFDLRWAATFGGGLLAGVLAATLGSGIRKKKRA